MPATAVDGVTVTFEVAWGKGVGDTVSALDWTDESAYVEAWSTNRGRQTELDQFTAGTLNVRLNNRTRRFDPDYTSGALYGNLKPGRPCRLRYTRSSVTYDVFYGFIDSLPQEWDAPNNATATIVAVDALAVLARTVLPNSRYAAEVLTDTPAAWWRLGDDDTIMLDSSGNARHGYYVGDTSTGDPLLNFTGVSSRTFSETGSGSGRVTSYAITASTFSLECWVTIPDGFATSVLLNVPLLSQGALDTSPGYIWFYLDYQSSGRVTMDVRGYSGVASNRSVSSATGSIGALAGTTAHIVYTRSSDTHKFYVNGAESTLTDTATGASWTSTTSDFLNQIILGRNVRFSSVDLATDVTLTEFAYYTSALSAARVLAHYNAGVTADAGNDIDGRITQVLTDAGITWLSTSLEDSQVLARGTEYSIGGGNVLGYLQALEKTEQGRLFVSAAGTLTFYSRYHDLTTTSEISFTDAAGSTYPYTDLGYAFDRTRVYNQAVTSRTNGTPQRYTDATSINANGPRSISLDGLQLTSDDEAYDVAVALVARYKDPAQRYERISVNMRKAPNTLYAAIGTLEIGDKVSVTRTPQNVGNATTRTVTVEGISHSYDHRSTTWTVELLTAAANMPSYLIIDSGTLGQLDEEKVGF